MVLEQLVVPIVPEPRAPSVEAVATVTAETLFQARDASEAVEVETTCWARHRVREADGAETIWPSAADRGARSGFRRCRRRGGAFAKAELVVEQTFVNQRISNCQMEPRSGVGAYDKAADSYTLISGNQGVHAPRMVLAESWGVPLEKSASSARTSAAALGCATISIPSRRRPVGRPARWPSGEMDRASESFLTDYAGRDLVTTARLAFTKEGRITAYHVDHIGTCGGQTVTYVPLSNAYRVATMVYDIPLMHMRCRSMMTDTVPTAPFRGAGRPEATLVLERLIDLRLSGSASTGWRSARRT